MNFFKYLFALIITIFSMNAFSKCAPELYGGFDSTLADPPYTICAHHPDFGSDKCVMAVHNMQKTSTGWTLFAKTTGENCNQVTDLNPDPVQYDCKNEVCPVKENQICPAGYKKGTYNGVLSCVKDQQANILQCTLDYCENPLGKACPSGYRKGSFNGQSVCSKKIEPTEPDEGETDDKGTIVEAVNNAKNGITDSVSNLGGTISNSIDNFWNKLKEYLDSKNIGGDGSGDGSGDGDGDGSNNWGEVDTSGLDADVPMISIPLDHQKFDENIFYSNASCPPDNTLKMNFLGRQFSYTFSYSEYCNALSILGFFILTLAYCYGAILVVRS